ncbi:hypothetical protein MPTK2_3g15210 [Marchantia polymorpha subsp. ruderalis]
MADAVVIMSLGVVGKAVKKLILALLDVRESKQHSKIICKEIDLFVETLNENIKILEVNLPASVSRRALESLVTKLGDATAFVQSRQRQGFFKTLWNAHETKQELEMLRRNLDSSFQMALFITTLDVAVDGHNKIEDFQMKMLEIHSTHASSLETARSEIRDILVLLLGVPKKEKLQSLISVVQNMLQTVDTEKFFADVLANLDPVVPMEDDEQSTVINADDDEDINDPITWELMCDPVKGTDGRTYDRWTIINNYLTRSPFDQSKPFRIECDDINVRGRLFRKYPKAEDKFLERRHDYRKKAMKLARGGHDAEALVMLENVLKWADDDSECLDLRDLILKSKSQQDFATGINTTSSRDIPPRSNPGQEEKSRAMIAIHELKSIICLLSKETADSPLREAARNFANLARDSENKVNMAMYPGALESLVGLLTLDVPESALYEVSRGFANLSSARENQEKMAKVPQCLERLVQLMHKEVPRSIQREAARAFANLASAKENRLKMGAVPGILETLVDLFTEDVGERVQRSATRAFANLATAEENILKLAAVPKALEKVVDLLCKEVPVAVQFEAAKAVANIARAEECSAKLADFPGVLLERLVGLMSTEVHKAVQFEATRAFANLSHFRRNERKLITYPQAVDRVVSLLSSDVEENIQAQAARAFANLAMVRENLVEMAAQPGVLKRLVDLLARGTAEHVQIEAARAIAYLSYDDENQITIAAFPGALKRLVGLLSRDVPLSVLEQAALAFANLACAQANKGAMVSFPGALKKLVGLLGKGTPSSIQFQAAAAFADLAWGAEETRVRMATFPGAIERLVGLLSDDVDENVQAQAARALAKLRL